MEPSTLEMIKKIRSFRADTNLPLCFTLDAGPNVHLLYPLSCENEAKEFIKSELVNFCENGRIIYDCVGTGPVKISF